MSGQYLFVVDPIDTSGFTIQMVNGKEEFAGERLAQCRINIIHEEGWRDYLSVSSEDRTRVKKEQCG